MKKFFISDNSTAVGIDMDTEDLFSLEAKREAIQRIFIAEEPMKVVVNRFGKKYEIDADKDDIIIAFYEDAYEQPVVVIKNEPWVKNIQAYDEKMKEYGNKMQECDCCEKCRA